MILFFFMIFIAYSLPVSFFLTKMTLEKPPLPMTFICSNSFLSTSFCLLAVTSILCKKFRKITGKMSLQKFSIVQNINYPNICLREKNYLSF